MIFLTNARIALDALKASRTRTYLTMLGIIIGVSTITLILSLGQGIKQAVSNQVKSLDHKLIIVRPGSTTKGILSDKGLFSYSPLSSYATTTITEADYTQLAAAPEFSAVAPLMLINGSIRHGRTATLDSPILATTPDLEKALKLHMSTGQFLDDITARDTVVLGNQLAIDLYGTDQPLGEQLKIRGRDHIIVGILRKSSGPLGVNGVDLNNAAIVSLEDGKSFNQGIAQIQQINLVPEKGVSNGAAKASIRHKLLKSHNHEEDFSVLNSEDASTISRDFYQFITSLTAVVAMVSLVVGGIGIMNIMLVGVAERTREIGIRKSLGASNRHIMWQFLIESLMMSVTGGLIGVLVGYGAASFIGILLGFLPAFNWVIITIALGLSIGVGAVFGLAPAMRAARKDPIEALRQHS
jgi:ABC-type antimicrobial peptide transport system permease subunit